MVRAIMHGCNGAMGQVISGIAAKDEEISIVAGIDMRTEQKNDYPVFASLNECKVEADVVIDFSNAAAVDELLDWCAEKKMPVVLCTTGLSEVQLAKVEETAEKTAVLRSANMSLGINMLLKLLKEAAQILAPAGFDIEIVCGGPLRHGDRTRPRVPGQGCGIPHPFSGRAGQRPDDDRVAVWVRGLFGHARRTAA